MQNSGPFNQRSDNSGIDNPRDTSSATLSLVGMCHHCRGLTLFRISPNRLATNGFSHFPVFLIQAKTIALSVNRMLSWSSIRISRSIALHNLLASTAACSSKRGILSSFNFRRDKFDFYVSLRLVRSVRQDFAASISDLYFKTSSLQFHDTPSTFASV